MSGWKLSALALLALGAADLVALNAYFPDVWAPGEVQAADNAVKPVSPGPPREPVAKPEEPEPSVEPVADDTADSKQPEPVLVSDNTGKPEPVEEPPEEPGEDVVEEPPVKPPREELVARSDDEPPGDEPPEVAGTEATILFDTGRILLDDVSKAKLRKIVKLLKNRSDLLVLVEGHADQRGDEDQNLNLSSLRAKSVALFLRRRGVSRIRVRTAAYGETRLLIPENSPSAWQKNRRVVVRIHKGEP
jgi:outer membrane protein OmpA-like peptidoglycan-associated protein